MPECFPIFKGAIYNTTVAIDADFFQTDLLPTQTPTTFLIYFYPTTGPVPRLKIKHGGNTIIETLNAQSTYASYMFQTVVGPGDSINLTTPDGGTCGVGRLIVIEIETMRGNAVFNIPRMG